LFDLLIGQVGRLVFVALFGAVVGEGEIFPLNQPGIIQFLAQFTQAILPQIRLLVRKQSPAKNRAAAFSAPGK
jgi:hypothetical protein